MLVAHDFYQMLYVLGQTSQGHVSVKSPVSPQIASEEIASNHSLGLCNEAKLLISQVASTGT